MFGRIAVPCILAVAGSIVQQVEGYTAPNIIFMIADDIGWSDYGYYGYDMSGATPTIDQLASEGVKLNCVYGGIGCSPGRSQFLTGRYAIRHGIQKGGLNNKQAKGIPVNNTLIAAALSSVGYATAAVGKWHVGCAWPEMTPTYRGFDSFVGFVCSGEMSFTEKTNDGYLDLWNGTTMITDESLLSEDVRSSWIYDAGAEDFIRGHGAKGTGQPFFLYYAQQDPHSPLSAPDYFLESSPCVNIQDEDRQIYCGMMRCIDTSVEGMMAAISDIGQYSNTLFVASGDNGGAPKNGGYNYPLRGSKGTLFEGGIRQNSWIWGAMLPSQVVGTTYYDQLHVTDFFPTFMSIATAGMWHPNYDYDLDGMDVWAALSMGFASPRNESLLNTLDSTGGLRLGDFVYLEGVSDDGWYIQPDMKTGEKVVIQHNKSHLLESCASVTMDNETGRLMGDGCNYLFNVASDPTQQTNLASYSSYATLISTMSTKLQAYMAAAVDYNVDSGKEDGASDIAESTGYWGPWRDDCNNNC